MLNYLDRSRSLIFLTNRIGRMMASIIRRRFSEQDQELTSTHMGILADLWQQDGIAQQELVVSSIKDKGTIARALAKMEKENIVLRVPDQQDKRSKLIYLTHKGKQLEHDLMPIAAATQQELTQNIDPTELEICLKVLTQIYNNLGDSCKSNDIKKDK